MKIIGFDNKEYETIRIDSLSELNARASEIQPSLILGNKRQCINSFCLIKLDYQVQGQIGLCLNQSELFSGFIKVKSGLLVYCDNLIFLIDKNLRITWELPTGSIIYEIFRFQNEFIVIEELGAFSFSLNKKINWIISSDIVEDFKIFGSELRLTADGITNHYSLLTGKKIENDESSVYKK